MLKVGLRPSRLAMGATRVHYGWLIAIMAAALQVSTSFINQAFAVLLPIIQETFGWSLTAITLGYFFKMALQAALSPMAGWLAEMHGARTMLFVGATLHVVGLLLLSQITEVWQFLPVLQRYPGHGPVPLSGKHTHHRGGLVSQASWCSYWHPAVPGRDGRLRHGALGGPAPGPWQLADFPHYC